MVTRNKAECVNLRLLNLSKMVKVNLWVYRDLFDALILVLLL